MMALFESEINNIWFC